MAPNLLRNILTGHLLWVRGIKELSHRTPKMFYAQALERVFNLLFPLEYQCLTLQEAFHLFLIYKHSN